MKAVTISFLSHRSMRAAVADTGVRGRQVVRFRHGNGGQFGSSAERMATRNPLGKDHHGRYRRETGDRRRSE